MRKDDPIGSIPLMYDYENPQQHYYNPDYPRQLKETFQAHLREQAASGKNLKETYEQFSFSNETLLMIAAYTNDMALAEFLIAIGVDVNQKAISETIYRILDLPPCVEETALHYAARAGNKQMYDFLVQNGADEKALNKHGKSPMDVWNEKKY